MRAAAEPQVCFITTCMGRLSSLKRSLPTFSRQRNSRVIVVDYSCPDNAGTWVETHHPECRVVRVPDRKFFHLSHARNVGFRAVAADADWVCFVDADVCLSPSFYENVQPLLEPGRFIVAPMHPKNKGLTGLILVPHADFFRYGGFDEAYENYGREASAMRVTLFGRGLTPVFLGDGLARHMDHEDEVRSRHYRQKDLVRSNLANSRRLRALIDETEIETGKDIPPELCYKDKSRNLWRHALLPLRDTYLLCERFWRSTRNRR
jgi:glycosyl transferase family 2